MIKKQIFKGALTGESDIQLRVNFSLGKKMKAKRGQNLTGGSGGQKKLTKYFHMGRQKDPEKAKQF